MVLELALAVAGGLVAGVVALAVGGLGVLSQLRRSVKILAQGLDDTDLRLEREIKRRNADSAPPRARGATRSDVLAELGVEVPPEKPESRAAIMARYRGA